MEREMAALCLEQFAPYRFLRLAIDIVFDGGYIEHEHGSINFH